MPLADISAEAARWFGLIGLGASACMVWLLLFIGAHLARRDRWKTPLLWVLPLLLLLTAGAMVGLLTTGPDR